MTAYQAERTFDGEYEEIDYHTFEAVDYPRLMSWKSGKGKISVGVREMTQRPAGEDKVDEKLPKRESVVVSKMCFKLVRA